VSETTRLYRDGSGWEEAAGYSRSVRRSGRIAVSGTTATGADGRALYPGDTYRQARAALERALTAVRELGGGPQDVMRSRIYLTPDADWHGAVQAHVELLGAVAPANTTIRVAGLIGEGFLVEVELDAEVP
jgi:enamine deaminase RidA (YjgF/YER057c/UK114 family)